MQDIIHRLLLKLPPEYAHYIALGLLSYAPPDIKLPDRPIILWGKTFSHPIGLAAGLDKNADYLPVWKQLGFSFVEMGTATPKPQPGNPSPRLFRLNSNQAIINRMGFNNLGIHHLVDNIKYYRQNHADHSPLIGINIGKNAVTPLERAIDDYQYGLKVAYPYADYIVINISSPNTKGLRRLQHGETLYSLLKQLQITQNYLAEKYASYVPLLVKISPDMTWEEYTELAQILKTLKIDGVIATNTTVGRQGVEGHLHALEMGGLSGAPLTNRSTEVIQYLYNQWGEDIPIIASGGIMDQSTAMAKLAAGAKLIQLYSGFIYRGPDLLTEIAKSWTLPE